MNVISSRGLAREQWLGFENSTTSGCDDTASVITTSSSTTVPSSNLSSKRSVKYPCKSIGDFVNRQPNDFLVIYQDQDNQDLLVTSIQHMVHGAQDLSREAIVEQFTNAVIQRPASIPAAEDDSTEQNHAGCSENQNAAAAGDQVGKEFALKEDSDSISKMGSDMSSSSTANKPSVRAQYKQGEEDLSIVELPSGRNPVQNGSPAEDGSSENSRLRRSLEVMADGIPTPSGSVQTLNPIEVRNPNEVEGCTVSSEDASHTAKKRKS